MNYPYNFKRAAGGYYHHAVMPGSYAAMCGFEPGKNARQHLMVDRSGWRIGPRINSVTCPRCKAAIEKKEAQ